MARICRSVNARPLETEILVSLFDEWEAFVKSYSKCHWFPLLPQWSAKNVSAVWSIRLRFDEIMDSTYPLDGNLNCRSRRRESWNYCSFVPKIIPQVSNKNRHRGFSRRNLFFFVSCCSDLPLWDGLSTALLNSGLGCGLVGVPAI